MAINGVRSAFVSSAFTSGEEGFVSAATRTWAGATGDPLIFVHGAGQFAASAINTPEQARMIHKLSEFFTVGLGDFGGDGTSTTSWGNGHHVNRIHDCKTVLSSYWNSPSPAVLMGVSMGASGILNYARTYPGNVKAVIGIIPALDLGDLHDNRGFSSAINASYSSGADLSYRTSRNPVFFASAMDASIPILLLTSSTDTTTVPSTAAAFKAARPTNTTVVDVGTNGHSFASVAEASDLAIKFARTLSL